MIRPTVAATKSSKVRVPHNAAVGNRRLGKIDENGRIVRNEYGATSDQQPLTIIPKGIRLYGKDHLLKLLEI